MSFRQLAHIEIDLLAKGLNFSITSKTLPNKDIISTIENAEKDFEKEEADTIHAKIRFTFQHSKPPKNNLSKDECKALKEWQSDTSIIILPAEKGRSTVKTRSLAVRTIWKMYRSYKQRTMSIT